MVERRRQRIHRKSVGGRFKKNPSTTSIQDKRLLKAEAADSVALSLPPKKQGDEIRFAFLEIVEGTLSFPETKIIAKWGSGTSFYIDVLYNGGLDVLTVRISDHPPKNPIDVWIKVKEFSTVAYTKALNELEKIVKRRLNL